MNRVPFDGSTEGLDSCPRCGVLDGEKHYIGCMGEECPKCGNPLVTCACRVLHPEDKMLAVRRLYNTINSRIAAWTFAAYFPHKSPLGLAGWLWACLNDDPEFIVSLVRTEAGVLTNIKSSFCNASGLPRFSAGDVARALGLGKREVVELERVFVGAEVGRKAETLMRVH